MAFTRTASGLCVANLHATNDHPEMAAEDVLLAARTATEWAGERAAALRRRPQPAARREPRPSSPSCATASASITPTTAPGAIDHLLARGLEVVEPPAPWPPERREVRQGELAVRLSDHAPVEARFALRLR